MRLMRRSFGALLLLTGGVAAGQPAAAAPGYTIDVVLSLTGGGAFLGQAEQRTLQLAAPLISKNGGIHGRPVSFVFHDDQTSPQVAVQLVSQIKAGNPPVIIGSTLTGSCNAMAPLARAAGPVIYCLSPGIHPKPGSFVFSASVSSLDLARSMVRYLRSTGLTKLALITSSDASGQDATRGVKAVLAEPENKDVTLVDEEHFNPGDVSVSGQIDRIKAASPQALIAWTSGGPLGIVLKTLVNAGLDVPVATTDANMTYTQMRQYGSFLPKQLLFPAPPWLRDVAMLNLPPASLAVHKTFFDLFKGTAPPDKGSTLSYDPAMIVVQALNALPDGASAEQLRAKIAGMTGYEGLFGSYDFSGAPQRGLTLQNVVMTAWDAKAQQWHVVSQPGGAPLAGAGQAAQ